MSSLINASLLFVLACLKTFGSPWEPCPLSEHGSRTHFLTMFRFGFDGAAVDVEGEFPSTLNKTKCLRAVSAMPNITMAFFIWGQRLEASVLEAVDR